MPSSQRRDGISIDEKVWNKKNELEREEERVVVGLINMYAAMMHRQSVALEKLKHSMRSHLPAEALDAVQARAAALEDAILDL